MSDTPLFSGLPTNAYSIVINFRVLFFALICLLGGPFLESACLRKGLVFEAKKEEPKEKTKAPEAREEKASNPGGWLPGSPRCPFSGLFWLGGFGTPLK